MRRRVLPSVIVASVALALTVAITVGWNVMFAQLYGPAFDDGGSTARRVGYWFLMALGDLFLVAVMTAIGLVLAAAVRRTRALRQQDAFLDRITHELRTPITGMRLALDTWHRRQLSGAALEELQRGMRDDLDRLNELVEHVIQTSRLEHGERHATHETCDIGDLLDHAARRIRHELEERVITVEVERAPTVIFSDPVALEEIVLNLLDNAVKYAGNQPEITVSAGSEGDRCTIAVRDNGVGVEPQHKTRIFKRFHRGDNHSSRRRPGSGLGLYIVAELCRQLGGSISVESDGPDRGTIFTVTLPIGTSDHG